MDLMELLNRFVSKFLPPILMFIVGVIFIKFAVNFLRKALEKSKLDPLCHRFLLSLAKAISYLLLMIMVLTGLGVDMTSLVALMSVAGIAISLSVQDSLSNLAGGIVLLLTRPFNVNDFVEIGDVKGTVQQISILQTQLHTIDNKMICIPNGQVSSAVLVNYSACTTRRLDLIFSIAYSDDFNKAKKIIRDIVEAHPKSLKDPGPTIRMCEMAASSINITCRVWVNTEDFWDLNFDLLEQVKTAFDNNGISIPFNQLDVHMISKDLTQF